MKRLVNYTQTVLLRLLQSRRLFPLWLKLNHYSCVFLNFYRGAAPVNLSGESYIIQYVSSSKRRHDSPAIIIDVGANRGKYSDLVLHYFDDTIKVFLFEPTPILCKELTSKFLRYPNVSVYECALAASRGQQLFSLNKGGSQLNSLLPPEDHDNQTKDSSTILVKTQSFDAFCEDNQIANVLLLKIDVEGYEPDVLEGSKNIIRSRSVDFIQLEYSNKTITKMSFESLFNSYSDLYHFYILCSDGLRKISSYDSAFESAECMLLLLELK